MWAGAGGPRPWGWQIQQAAFANVPHEQVDWATLAKQWIQQKPPVGHVMTAVQPAMTLVHMHPQPTTVVSLAPAMAMQQPMIVHGMTSLIHPGPPPQMPTGMPPMAMPGTRFGHTMGFQMPPVPQQPQTKPPPPPAPLETTQSPAAVPLKEDVDKKVDENKQETDGMEIDNSQADTEDKVGENGNGDQTWGWGNGSGSWDQSWAAPEGWQMPVVPANQAEYTDDPSQDYGHGYHQYDYNHGGQYDETSEWQGDRSGGSWPMAPYGRPQHVPHGSAGDSSEGINEDIQLDIQRRKLLPAWIREGLEKMEQQKQKEEEKEKLKKDKEEQKKKNEEEKAAKEEEERQMVERGELSPSRLRKSKFDDSGSDVSDAEPEVDSSNTAANRKSRFDKKSIPSPVKKRSPSPPEVISEEEKQARMLLAVRKMLTEVLISVTTSEIESLAKEVYAKEKQKASKAPAKQLASSTALASLTSLGLGYGSGSDDDDKASASGAENSAVEVRSDSDTDDEEIVQERIRRKKREFDRKMREREEEERRLEKEAKKDLDMFERVGSRSHQPGIPGLDIQSEHSEPSTKLMKSKSREHTSEKVLRKEERSKDRSDRKSESSRDLTKSASNDSSDKRRNGKNKAKAKKTKKKKKGSSSSSSMSSSSDSDSGSSDSSDSSDTSSTSATDGPAAETRSISIHKATHHKHEVEDGDTSRVQSTSSSFKQRHKSSADRTDNAETGGRKKRKDIDSTPRRVSKDDRHTDKRKHDRRKSRSPSAGKYRRSESSDRRSRSRDKIRHHSRSRDRDDTRRRRHKSREHRSRSREERRRHRDRSRDDERRSSKERHHRYARQDSNEPSRSDRNRSDGDADRRRHDRHHDSDTGRTKKRRDRANDYDSTSYDDDNNSDVVKETKRNHKSSKSSKKRKRSTSPKRRSTDRRAESSSAGDKKSSRGDKDRHSSNSGKKSSSSRRRKSRSRSRS